jgi:hypothetical membrane protein
MFDVIGIIYFTLIILSLLFQFPLRIYEFIDLQEGFAFSDYALIHNTNTIFNTSAIITGFLCGLDSITNPLYKKIDKKLYKYHSFFSFAFVGIGFFPVLGINGWYLQRLLHWFFACSFLFGYPYTRLLILRKANKKLYRKVFLLFLTFSIPALFLIFNPLYQKIAYPEALLWLGLLIVIISSKTILRNKKR